MLIESAIILLLVMIVFIVYMRSQRPALGMSILLLGIFPVFNMIGIFIQSTFENTLLMTPLEWRLFLIILGISLSCILFGTISIKIEKQTFRRCYLFLCGGFTLFYGFLTLSRVIILYVSPR